MMRATTLNVSRETELQLQAYVAHLQKWNSKINLIAKAGAAEIWNRHIEDGLQLVALIPPSAKTLVDLGSGAGLPGLVLAIACPALAVTLVEQDTRKAAFLRDAARVVGLGNVTVCEQDIAKHEARYDVVTARALAPLSQLCHYAIHLIHKDSICLFPKGEAYANELVEAQQNWQMQTSLIPSVTQPKANIVSITELKPLGG